VRHRRLRCDRLRRRIPDISIAELKTAIAEKKVTVIDVERRLLLCQGPRPDRDQLRRGQGPTLPPSCPPTRRADRRLLRWPSCSAYTKAANAAKELGYTNIKHLSAGISGWLQAGEATEK